MVKENVKVIARVRPSLDGFNGESSLQTNSRFSNIAVNGKQYQMDKVFNEDATQEAIFKDVKPVVDGFLNGLNGTIFAYGQTGSGKTHTMLGRDTDYGIMPRAIEKIFAILNEEVAKRTDNFEYTLKCSFLQLYNEEPYDLLNENKKLKIQAIKEHINVKDIVEITVTSSDDCIKILFRGCENRNTAKTCMNDESSRSHGIFMLSLATQHLEKNETHTITSRLNLVDLAGSERQSQTNNIGVRLAEAGNINKSLTTLGRVIRSITKAEEHVPYRDSKLTLLLRDSIGGNSNTIVIVNIHPGSQFADETISTLNFALAVKEVKNSAFINEIVTSKETSTMIAEDQKHRQEIVELKSDLIKANENFQKHCSEKDKKIESFEKELKEANDRELKKQDETFVLEEGKAKLEVKLEGAKSQNERYDNEVVKKNLKIKTSNMEIKELRDRISKLEAEVAEKDRQIQRNEIQRLSENFGSHEVEIGQSENQFVDKRIFYVSATENLSSNGSEEYDTENPDASADRFLEEQAADDEPNSVIFDTVSSSADFMKNIENNVTEAITQESNILNNESGSISGSPENTSDSSVNIKQNELGNVDDQTDHLDPENDLNTEENETSEANVHLPTPEVFPAIIGPIKYFADNDPESNFKFTCKRSLLLDNYRLIDRCNWDLNNETKLSDGLNIRLQKKRKTFEYGGIYKDGYIFICYWCTQYYITNQNVRNIGKAFLFQAADGKYDIKTGGHNQSCIGDTEFKSLKKV